MPGPDRLAQWRAIFDTIFDGLRRRHHPQPGSDFTVRLRARVMQDLLSVSLNYQLKAFVTEIVSAPDLSLDDVDMLVAMADMVTDPQVRAFLRARILEIYIKTFFDNPELRDTLGTTDEDRFR
jgi:hypothetical protein